MSVTLKMIAERVGKSITTVSRALAGYDDVSEATRQQVQQVALELGYEPNIVARQLQKQRTDTLALILPTFGPRFSDPFFSEFLAGVGNEAAQQGFDLLKLPNRVLICWLLLELPVRRKQQLTSRTFAAGGWMALSSSALGGRMPGFQAC
jgi:hypothetical protein